jgi:hypothetical protein
MQPPHRACTYALPWLCWLTHTLLLLLLQTLYPCTAAMLLWQMLHLQAFLQSQRSPMLLSLLLLLLLRVNANHLYVSSTTPAATKSVSAATSSTRS